MQDYNIVYCCSDYYAPHLGVSIVSILENISVKNRVNFHILDFGISTKNKAKLQEIIQKYNALNHIFLYDSLDFRDNIADSSDIKDFANSAIGGGRSKKSRYNITFYEPHLDSTNKQRLAFFTENYIAFWAGVPSLYRLFLQDIFIQLDSCLFLGCDVVALRCISHIFAYDLQEFFAIASENKAVQMSCDSTKINDLMNNFCKNFNRRFYFDPDMILLNLAKMRKAKISQKFYDYAKSCLSSPHKANINAEEGIWHLGFEDNVRILPHSFCFTLNVKSEKGRENLSDLPIKDILKIEAKKAIFVHYACLKPWYVNYARLDTQYYWHYRDLSPFKMSIAEKYAFKIRRYIYFTKIFIAKIPLIGSLGRIIYRVIKKIFKILLK